MHKGHGDVHGHRKRRRRNLNEHLYREDEYELIDGNTTHYPSAYCNRYAGYLTMNLEQVHGCAKKGCQYYDVTSLE